MKSTQNQEPLEYLVNQYEERATDGKEIPAEVREYAKRQARETLRRVLIGSDTTAPLYRQTNCIALSDRVWHLLESYF
jgi:hypothetical protein